jgi:hypothetical protein
MSLKLTRSTGLNLTLEGSVGKFRIGGQAGGDNKSLEVLYLETHIGFDPNIASNEAMLRQLEPVREIFDFQTLGFDEIMQRDIDDARVSTELIPYLLDAGARDTIKFFPPIVVVVLPVQDRVLKPDTRYPKVTRERVDNDPERGVAEIVRAGAVGAEAFQFEYPIVDGVARLHDLARLKLNTNKVRLVIIDGQHRAMALLALYRNLREEWNDARRMPFKDYYREWTKSRIMSFNLAEIQLPIIVCTYPDLDPDYAGDFDIIRAARSTFLTLNKTARKVSNSRNILLDDRDLVSHFLRHTLGHIKQKDVHSGSSMRIWNVELDQYRDRVKIESPIACTGVSHVYYSIEHMMFDDNDVKGLGARSGKFHKRAYVEGSLLRRLDGENLLGRDTAATLKRHTYTMAAAKQLSEAFHDRYGQFLVAAFDTFKPYEIHNKATLETEASLQGHTNPQIRTILFEGQNIGRTFSDYLDYMVEQERDAKDSRSPLAPEIQTILGILRGTERSVEETRQKMLKRRAAIFVDAIPDKGKLKSEDGDVSKNLRKPLDDLYDDVFTSVAFQAALVCGYFLVIEKAERLAGERSATLPARAQSFQEYIESLNGYFVPATLPRLKNLLKAFFYDVEGERAEEWKPVPTGDTFGSVVFRGEMKPDEWPKYRYLLLELWHSADPIIDEVRKAERDLCRRQAFESLHARNTRETCVELRKNEQDLTEPEWKAIFDRTYKAFDGLLRNLGLKAEERWTEAQARQVIAKPEPAPAEAEEAPVA